MHLGADHIVEIPTQIFRAGVFAFVSSKSPPIGGPISRMFFPAPLGMGIVSSLPSLWTQDWIQ